MDQLAWLPEHPAWREGLRALATCAEPWPRAVALANTRLDFTRTNALDTAWRRRRDTGSDSGTPLPVRLAVLGTSTIAHLLPAIRVALMRRNMTAETYEPAYGQYLQELLDPASDLHRFRPTAVLLAPDAHHLARPVYDSTDAAQDDAALAETLAHLEHCWALARDAFRAHIIQQTALPVFPAVLGSNEHRLAGSPAGFIARLNAALRPAADRGGVDLLALDTAAASHGLAAWHDPALWHRARQEVTPARAPSYGELVARLIAARLGRSRKCLVMDLDNTLWGGTIGDDGLDGIVLGQGSPLGEGFAAVQSYAKSLARRGIILAVSSKNDEARAWEPFDRHPDMVLRRADIASLRANWADKPANLRAIAAELNIGLDALVFLDDNPFERNLVRAELPMVAVPEVPDDDPARIPALLADAGYFESTGLTAEDRERTAQYQTRREHTALQNSATDLDAYLRALEMRLVWRRFDAAGRQRIVQLIGKTNQFNLTTRRHTEADIDAVIADPASFGLYLRLLDRFGDNGIIAVVIGRSTTPGTVTIDTWLMSCRVLGRGVERATLGLIMREATRLGAHTLIGEFIASGRNEMVADLYTRLGFTPAADASPGVSRATLDLGRAIPDLVHIDIHEGTP